MRSKKISKKVVRNKEIPQGGIRLRRKEEKPLRILVFGDVVGKPGRHALCELIPFWRKKHKVDYCIANVENLAHGDGITRKTLDETLSFGVDYCTSGNHVLKKNGAEMLADPSIPVIRPANFHDGSPGRGAALVSVGTFRLLLINLIGTAFFKEGETYSNPFVAVDQILQQYAKDKPNGIIVDWHAEATSEKVAMGWHLDGRVSAVFGTHTHVPTSDLRILPQGTAFRTDLGMTGLRDHVLGVDREVIVHNFVQPGDHVRFSWPDDGPIQAHAVLLDIDPTIGDAIAVQALDSEIVT